MGATKKFYYPKRQLFLSNLCKALGHPARVSIVEMLSKNIHLNCADLNNSLKLSQATISRHCQILHQSGIIGYEVVGNNCFYHLDNQVLNQIVDFLDTINIETLSITGDVYYSQAHL